MSLVTALKPILIVSHITCEHPGYFCAYMHKLGVSYQRLAVNRDESLPMTTNNMSGLVFLGAPVSVNDGFPWITAELALIKAGVLSGIPVLGICFGGQLISKALGGKVCAAPSMQIGWHHITLAAQATDVFGKAVMPCSFEAFEWHGDTFSLPQGAVPLFEGGCIQNQGFVFGNCLALQFHPEITEAMVHAWIDRYAHCLTGATECIQDGNQMLDNISERLAQQRVVADSIFDWWLDRVREYHCLLLDSPCQT